MAKGSSSKQIIIQKILETFPGSFTYDNGKEIRIPMVEDGDQIQIKVGLTCAKVNVAAGDDTAIPNAGSVSNKIEKITPEEAQEVRNLIKELDL